MEQNPFTFLGQAISQLLSTHSAAMQTTGMGLFRGLAVILIAWFGIKSALGHGGFNFAHFADLLLVISFGLGMLTYYSSPIPGVGYSFSDLITREALQISGQIESDQTQQIANAIVAAEERLGSPPGIFSLHETLTFLVVALALAAMQAVAGSRILGHGQMRMELALLSGTPRPSRNTRSILTPRTARRGRESPGTGETPIFQMQEYRQERCSMRRA